MQKRCFALLLASILSLSSTELRANSLQYENQLIEHFDIEVMNELDGCSSDTRAIVSRIKTRGGQLFNQSTFDNDLKILVNDFDRIDPTISCENGKVNIYLRLWPKPTISEIVWQGNAKISSSDLLSELGINSCAIFDRRAFNTAFNKLKTYYIQQGFFEAQLSYEVIPIPGCNEVQIQINVNEGRAGRIKQIYFCGINQIECNDLADKIATKRYCLFTSWLTGEGNYQDDAIRQDELQIYNYFHDIGFADVKVSIEVCEADQDNRIVIFIKIDKGNPFNIGCITVSGNTLYTEEEIRERFFFTEGSIYSPEMIQKAITRISDYYGKDGYIDTIVNYEPKLSPDKCAYDIDISIEESAQYRVGLIKVFGNSITQTRVILNECLVVPGEVFNIEKLKYTEERLKNIGYFKTVNVYPVKSDGPCGLGANYRDVHIEVEETATGHIGAFFGYSDSESLFGGLEITEKNLDDSGLYSVSEKGLSALRGGGQYTNFKATWGSKTRSYVYSWNKPYFNDTPWTVGYDIEQSSTRYVSDDYDFNSIGMDIHGIYRVNAYVKTGVHYRIDQSQVHVTHDKEKKDKKADKQGAVPAAEPTAEELAALAEKHEKEKGNNELRKEANHSDGVLSAVGASLVYDSTNHPLFPTRGIRSRLEFECVGIGGDYNFLSASYLNSAYITFPMDPKGVWRIRADTRFIQPYAHTSASDVPLDERFFLGGNFTIRGYKPYQPGPKFPGQDDPRGGVSLQYLSLEYSRTLFPRADLFLFVDSGHLSFEEWHFGRFDTAVGLGFRLGIIPGAPPVTLGYGFPINPRHKEDLKRFFFAMGGQF